MPEEGKKISFGFAKSIKKPALKNPVPQEEKKVDYIECLDDKGIKVIGEEKKKDEPLVIPLLGSKTWYDRIVNKIDADIFEPKTEQSNEVDDNEEEKSKLSNGNASLKIPIVKVEDDKSKIVTLEEQAAKEIIEELKSKDESETKESDLTLPLVDDSLTGKEQSTLDDYERIPVDAFGVAMLRGMGWQPGKGIGRSEKIVSAVIPELRPKGMGLGADKVTLQKKSTDSKKQEEELKIEKGTFVKIIAGKLSNNYGQIEGFDDDAGRLIIKLALGGNTITVNEFMVQPVTKSEYAKNSKVLNVKMYEQYSDKQSKEEKHKPQRKRKSSEQSDDSDEVDQKNSADENKKKNKSHSRETNVRKVQSDSDDSDNEYAKRQKRGRSSSSSSGTYKSKKSKKSKKHKRQDSPEKSSKKRKKKDKEKEKIKDRKSRDTNRRKHKKHGRSRSRSSTRR